MKRLSGSSTAKSLRPLLVSDAGMATVDGMAPQPSAR